MSEYPCYCDKCGEYIGYVHASEWGKYICERCQNDLKIEKEVTK